MSESATSEFIGRKLGEVHAEQRRARADMGMMIARVVGQSDCKRRFEQRLADQTDILVSEFKGRIGISQAMVERRMDGVSEGVEELETGKSRFTS